MALEFAKELLGDAYTGELEEKLEAKINELYAPKADLDAASARADGLQEQLNAANEAIGKFEGLDAEQVKAQIADYKQRAEAAEKDRDEKLAAAAGGCSAACIPYRCTAAPDRAHGPARWRCAR